MLQAKRLKEEFGATIEWRGYELFPQSLEWPDPSPAAESPTNKPATPTRFEFLLHADGLQLPESERPTKMRTYNAHQAVEYAKTEGVQDEFVEALYRAYWERGENINEPLVIQLLAEGIIRDTEALREAVASNKFADNVIGFDDDAYASGVYNVPTFFIGENRYAEQPYTVLREAVQKLAE